MAEKERPFDYEHAAKALAQLFGDSENLFRDGKEAPVPKVFAQNVDALFASKTQSYRDVALGCGLVRLLDKSLNLRLPYVNQGKGAFNGRTLDEDVVNPFLHDRQVPASKGPYLATFRRSVKFDDATREGAPPIPAPLLAGRVTRSCWPSAQPAARLRNALWYSARQMKREAREDDHRPASSSGRTPHFDCGDRGSNP